MIARGVITHARPVLASLDHATTTAFYTRLGFSVAVHDPDYLILGRDGIELHFWRCEDRRIAEATSCYLRSPSVDALHREFTESAGEIDMTEPRDCEWGMREFYVWDPNGNLLRFGQRVQQHAIARASEGQGAALDPARGSAPLHPR
jgi:catechol 2,3-dioxygenase-like lactoylglutathione lyase family enzyme